MAHEVSDEIHDQVVAVIGRMWNDGCPVASRQDEMASIAIRRWLSSNRRGVKSSDIDGRVRDLTKGLISHFESNPALVGPLRADYDHVARAIAAVLLQECGG